jgi:hypothetical protein
MALLEPLEMRTGGKSSSEVCLNDMPLGSSKFRLPRTATWLAHQVLAPERSLVLAERSSTQSRDLCVARPPLCNLYSTPVLLPDRRRAGRSGGRRAAIQVHYGLDLYDRTRKTSGSTAGKPNGQTRWVNCCYECSRASAFDEVGISITGPRRPPGGPR